MPRIILSIVVLCLMTTLAWSRPAVVRVFEVKVYEQPSTDAAVVAVLIEGQQLSVSEESEGGWHRVRLSDGRTAWIASQAISLTERLPKEVAPSAEKAAGDVEKPDPSTAPLGVPGVLPTPDRPFAVVADLPSLREAIAAEPALVAKVEALESRQCTARWLFFGGLAAGVLTVLTPNIINTARGESTSALWLYGGGLVLLAGQVSSWWFDVGQEDVEPIVTEWNKGHSDALLKYVE